MADPIGWVDVRRGPEVSVARIVGDVDISNVDEIQKSLEHMLEGDHDRCVIDLTETTYFDSSGIRLLFQFAAQLQTQRRELQIVVPEKTVIRRLLELTDLRRVAPLYGSMDEAEPVQ